MWHKHEGEGSNFFSHDQVKAIFEKHYQATLAEEESKNGGPMSAEYREAFRKKAWDYYIKQIRPYKKE